MGGRKKAWERAVLAADYNSCEKAIGRRCCAGYSGGIARFSPPGRAPRRRDPGKGPSWSRWGLGDRARGLGACAEIQTVRCDVGKDVALGCSTAARDPGAARRPRPAGPEKTRVDRVDRRPRRVSTSNPRPGGARGSSSGHTDSRGGAPRVREKVFVMLGARRTHPSSRRRRPGRGARGRRARARRRARRRRRRGRARRAQRGRR